MTDLIVMPMDEIERMIERVFQRELAAVLVTQKDEWLTMTQMCEKIGCSPDTVRRRVKCGEITAKGTGKARLYRVV